MRLTVTNPQSVTSCDVKSEICVCFLVRTILLMFTFYPKCIYSNPIYTFNVYIFTRHCCVSILSDILLRWIILDYHNIFVFGFMCVLITDIGLFCFTNFTPYYKTVSEAFVFLHFNFEEL
jgi:hypothetical protein